MLCSFLFFLLFFVNVAIVTGSFTNRMSKKDKHFKIKKDQCGIAHLPVSDMIL
jgi:hypothetical protein